MRAMRLTINYFRGSQKLSTYRLRYYLLQVSGKHPIGVNNAYSLHLPTKRPAEFFFAVVFTPMSAVKTGRARKWKIRFDRSREPVCRDKARTGYLGSLRTKIITNYYS